MLINKWLIVDDLNNNMYNDWKDGFCLNVHDETTDMSHLHRYFREQTFTKPFTILLSGKDLFDQNSNDRLIEKMITLFFQPSYYLVNYKPLLFLDNKTFDLPGLIKRVTEKCKKQGLDILVMATKDAKYIDDPINNAYYVTTSAINYDLVVDAWLNHYLDNTDAGEIHFLFSKKENDFAELLTRVLKSEMALHETEHYKFANAAYQKQKLLDEYKHELDIKTASEKDLRSYLAVQKKQTAENVEWYQHEYEILPRLYKRVGHVIKVLMGKRTFRSLFDNNIKKYKD